jgi:hypothetical protein
LFIGYDETSYRIGVRRLPPRHRSWEIAENPQRAWGGVIGIILAYMNLTCASGGLGDRAPEITRSLDRREGATVGRLRTLDERPAMMIQLTVFVPAVIAIYAATGAWVFSCDPISKTVDIVRGGLLYGWIGVLFMCARVLVFPY